MDSATLETFRTPPYPTARIWFALLAPPIAWAALGSAGFLAGIFGCPAGVDTRVIDIVVGAICVAVSGIALVLGAISWARTGDKSIIACHGADRPAFMGEIALFISAAFFIGVCWMCVGIIMLPQCSFIR